MNVNRNPPLKKSSFFKITQSILYTFVAGGKKGAFTLIPGWKEY